MFRSPLSDFIDEGIINHIFQCHIKKIVIIGGATHGLFAAILLKKMGLDVTVIDPRLGKYTRTGAVDIESFHNAEELLRRETKYSVKSYPQLKDLETSLFQDVQNCNLIKGTFLRFKNKNAQVKNAKGEIIEIACDLGMDYSGRDRVSISDVYFPDKSPAFTLAKVAECPVKRHLAAYIKLSDEDFLVLEKNSSKLYSDGDEIDFLSLTKLHELSWKYFSSPTFHIRPHINDEYMIYCEIPYTLPAGKEEDWLRVMLEIKSGGKKINVERVDEKKINFSTFTVDPHQVVENFYLGDENTPLLFLGGDAKIEPEYRVRIGIDSGTSRTVAVIRSFNIENGVITGIDFKRLEEGLREQLTDHIKGLSIFYKLRSQRLEKGLELMQEQCRIKLCEDKVTDLTALQNIRSKIAEVIFNNAQKTWSTATVKNEIVLNEEKEVANEIRLRYAKTLMLQALNLTISGTLIHSEICSALTLMAQQMRIISTTLFTMEKYDESMYFFQEALDIFINSFPEEFYQEIATQCANFIFIAKLNNQLFKAGKFFDYVLSLLYESVNLHPNLQKRTPLLGKICINLVERLLDDSLDPTGIFFSRGQIICYLGKMSEILELVSKIRNYDDPNYQRLREKFHTLAKLHQYPVKVENVRHDREETSFQIG